MIRSYGHRFTILAPGSVSARTVLRMVQFFTRFKGLSCSKLAQIWTERGQLLVEGFNLLKGHMCNQEALDFSSPTAPKFC
jgi:hypothetical protein